MADKQISPPKPVEGLPPRPFGSLLREPPLLTGKLSALQDVASELREASDTINVAINGVDQQLAAANIGLEVWLDRALTQSDAQGSTGTETVWTVQRLGYARVNGKWTLAVKRVRYHEGFFEGDADKLYRNEYVEGEPIALAQASRDVRITALRLLPALIDALQEAAKAAVRTIRDATNMLQ